MQAKFCIHCRTCTLHDGVIHSHRNGWVWLDQTHALTYKSKSASRITAASLVAAMASTAHLQSHAILIV